MVGILLMAFGLRAYFLDGQSLWSDEGISLLRSQRPLAELLETMPIEQMPGYFVLLNGWLRAAGSTDFALRYLSLWPSVLAVALVYRLGAALGNGRAGVVAATLLASSAFQIWYAQEARTYSWLVAVGLLCGWLFWRLVTADSRRGATYWLLIGAYGLVCAVLVYLHTYGALVPLAHVVFALVWSLWRRQWQFLRDWIVGGVVGLALFAPWLPRLLQIFNFPGWREPIDPWQIPWQVLTFYTAGSTLPVPWQAWLPWLYLALIGLGLVGWWLVAGRAAVFVLVSTVIPLMTAFAIALRTLDYHERYTIVAAAPLLLMVGGALAMPLPAATSWGRRTLRYGGATVAGLILLLLLVGNGKTVTEYYTNSDRHKPDFRGAVQMIEAFGQDGDIVIIDGPDPNLVFLHYYRAAYPIYDMRPFLGRPREETAAALAEYTAGAQRVWEVLLFHEPRAVQDWLGRNSWSTPARDFNGIRLTLYGVQDATLQQRPLDLPVGESLQLTMVALPAAPLQPGVLLPVSTHWQVTQPAAEYKFSLRLINAQGEIIMAQDYVPQNWFAPTSTWPVGGTTVDRRGFLLPTPISAGTYQVTLRLYDPATGAVAESAVGQDIVLGSVEIVP
jgi:hypothetical protein